jgi:hypothetical protein
VSHTEPDRAARNRIVGEVVARLAAADYEGIAAMAPKSRVTPSQMRAAVEQYGRTLLPLPLGADALIDYVAVRSSSPYTWSVVCPLFTAEEGRSDLSLELRLTQSPGANYTVEVDDLHVL